jgi:hypothetical protein
MAVDERHLVPVVREIPRGADADDAATEHEHAHYASACAATGLLAPRSLTGMQLQNRLRSP